MEPLISAKDLKKNFGKVEALKGVSLDVAEGEKVVVIGPLATPPESNAIPTKIGGTIKDIVSAST